MTNERKKIKEDLAKKKRNQLLFYIALVALPSIQFLFFYVYVNFNSIVLAFQKWNVDTASYQFNGLESFKQAFMFGLDDWEAAKMSLGYMIKNSLILFRWR